MPIQFDKFDQSKVDRLKNHLLAMAAKNQPKFYEVYVDNLKAVPRTDEPSEFESYEDYMTPDSSQLKVVIYNSASTNRNDQFVFLLKAKDSREALELGLNGFEDKTYTYNEITEWRQNANRKKAEDQQIADLKKQVADLKSELAEKDMQLDKFADAIEEAKQNGNKIGGIDLGAALSVALEGIVRRNTHLLAQVPMMQGLAGIIEQDNKRPAVPEQLAESEVQFKKKESSSGTLTEEEKMFMDFFKEMREHFSESEMGQVFEIMDNLSKDKTKLPVVVDLLQEK